MITTIDTPVGPGRAYWSLSPDPSALLVLGHGAGGGVESADLEALAEALPTRGISVLRFEQPWRTAVRRVGGQPTMLDKGWRALLATLDGGLPLFVGGRSAGARLACRCYEPPARGIVCLSFPLHPPGKPEKSRVAELVGADAPTLVLQGECDPFGSPDEVRDAAPGVRVVGVPGTHTLAPAGFERIADEVASFVLRR